MSARSGFTHLNVSTAYSNHYGVSWPQELAEVAASHDATMLACTDRDGLYGMAKHIKACLATGLHPIIGVNLAIAWDDVAPPLGKAPKKPAGRVTILANSAHNTTQGSTGYLGAGYQALVNLISAAHAHTTGGTTGGAPYALISELAQYAAPDVYGEPPKLYVLVGPESDAGILFSHRKFSAGKTTLRHWRKVLPLGATRVEVVNYLSSPGERLSTGHAVKAYRAARELQIPAVLTNAVRYATADGAATADVLDAARTLSSLDTTENIQPNGQGWLKTTREMIEIAREISREAGYGSRGVSQLLENTHQLAESCALDPQKDIGWGTPRVPEADVLGLEHEPQTELIQRARAGLQQRFGSVLSKTSAQATRIEERLEHELDIIENLGFASYFLTVAEVVDMIESHDVRVSARGSGASSLVNYALRISHVNPIEHDLLFERFLSRDRSTLPDIDIDVESERRHDIYHKIFERFGTQRTTLMSMQNGYRVRGAVRDAGRALGMGETQVDSIAKKLWRFSGSHFRDAMEQMPELKGFAQRLQHQRSQGEQQLDLLVDVTERIDRLPRHISMHPCGVILGDQHLLQRTPVQPSGMGLAMSQFDKHDMDPMGMLKLDVLGVRMQSSIAYSLQEIQRTTGERIVMEDVPHDDQATYEMIKTTHTLGCFQIESPGQRELIGKLNPETINDLIIDISLFRPGPMKSDMVSPFLNYRNQDALPHYPHPVLKPFLEETHGVVVFHEQLLRILNEMTGCGLARADELRRRLGSDTQEEVEGFFRHHALERGWSLDVIDEVWEILAAFGSFGFCKAHGAAFAIPTYQSAWLKTHYPAAFMAGVLEHDPGLYPRRLMIAEARRMGVPILPVDINASGHHMRLEWVDGHPEKPDIPLSGTWGIRLSWDTVSGLSAAEARRIVSHQPYNSLADIRDSARVHKNNLERLAQLGALDSLLPVGGASRSDLVYYLENEHYRANSRNTNARTRRQVEGQQAFPLEDTELNHLAPIFPEPTDADKVRTELDISAMDITGHLMDSHQPYLSALGVTQAKDLLSLRSRSRVLVAGVRVATQTPPMRSGKRVVFISLDDGTGVVDTAFFTEAQHNSGEQLFSSRLMLIEGTIRRTGKRAISIQAIRGWDMHQPETLPDPDYLASTRQRWAEWLQKDRQRVLEGKTTPIPVPHPETWEMMPMPSAPHTGESVS